MKTSLDLPRDHLSNDPQMAWLTIGLSGVAAVLSVLLIVLAVL